MLCSRQGRAKRRNKNWATLESGRTMKLRSEMPLISKIFLNFAKRENKTPSLLINFNKQGLFLRTGFHDGKNFLSCI